MHWYHPIACRQHMGHFQLQWFSNAVSRRAGRDGTVTQARKAHTLLHPALPALLHNGNLLLQPTSGSRWHNWIINLHLCRHTIPIPCSRHRLVPRYLFCSEHTAANRSFPLAIIRNSRWMHTQPDIDFHTRLVHQYVWLVFCLLYPCRPSPALFSSRRHPPTRWQSHTRMD